MKKFLLSAFAAVMGISAFAQYAVVGAYTEPNWNFQASTQFTEGADGIYTCTIDKLIGDFKIVDITNDNWNDQWGTATPVEINTVYTLDYKQELEGKKDPANIKFAGLIQSVSNALVKWNPATYEMEIVATEADLEIDYPTLYFTGNWNGNNWPAPGGADALLCAQTNGVYTVTVDLGTQEKTEFKLAGAGWSNEVCGGVEVLTTPVEVTFGGANLTTTLTGERELTFNYTTMTMFFSEELSGIESIVAENVPAVYFNLQGVRVENPVNGLYIVKQGDKVSKTFIR